MKKRFTYFLAFLFTVISIYSLSACQPAHGYCGYVPSNKKFNIDAVNIELRFGMTSHFRESRGYTDNTDNQKITLFFAVEGYTNYCDDFENEPIDFTNPALFFVRNIEPDEFFSDEYDYDTSGIFKKAIKRCKHSETLTIPEDAFIKDGWPLYFIVRIDTFYSEENPELYASFSLSTSIHYSIKNDKVTVS